MNEIERIKNEGILNDSFWSPTYIDGYYIDENEKEKRAIWLDLYIKFKKICDKYGLEYFAIYDTLLGTVRYNDFIPNATDINIGMPRESYNKLLSIKEQFEYPYFLQTPHTDIEYGYSFAKICNSETTVHVGAFAENSYNHGMVLDIFPLDFVTKDEYYIIRKHIYELVMECSAQMRLKKSHKTDRDNYVIEHFYSGRKLSEIYDEIQNCASSCSDEDSEWISTLTYTGFDADKCLWSKNIFSGYVEKSLSGVSIRIPSGYDELLKNCYYDDYMNRHMVYEMRWKDVAYYPRTAYSIYYSNRRGEHE